MSETSRKVEEASETIGAAAAVGGAVGGAYGAALGAVVGVIMVVSDWFGGQLSPEMTEAVRLTLQRAGGVDTPMTPQEARQRGAEFLRKAQLLAEGDPKAIEISEAFHVGREPTARRLDKLGDLMASYGLRDQEFYYRSLAAAVRNPGSGVQFKKIPFLDQIPPLRTDQVGLMRSRRLVRAILIFGVGATGLTMLAPNIAARAASALARALRWRP